jgi:hypothetical protein
MITRRRFGQLSGLAAGSVLLPQSVRAATPPDITLEIDPYTVSTRSHTMAKFLGLFYACARGKNKRSKYEI